MPEELRKDIERFVSSRMTEGYFGIISFKVHIQNGSIQYVLFSEEMTRKYPPKK